MKRSHTITLVAAKTTLGASLALGLLLSPHSTAHASPSESCGSQHDRCDASPSTAITDAAPVETINLTDVQDIDSLPVCTEEDCSDQVRQIGVWLDKDTGDWYVERGEGYTRRIIDNTVTGGAYLGPDTVGSDPADDPISRHNSVDIRIATGPNAYDAGMYVGGYN